MSRVESNQAMYYSANELKRAFINEELMLIPEDTELPPDFVQNGQNVFTSKMEFLSAEEFEQNKVEYGQILKC